MPSCSSAVIRWALCISSFTNCCMWLALILRMRNPPPLSWFNTIKPNIKTSAPCVYKVSKQSLLMYYHMFQNTSHTFEHQICLSFLNATSTLKVWKRGCGHFSFAHACTYRVPVHRLQILLTCCWGVLVYIMPQLHSPDRIFSGI